MSEANARIIIDKLLRESDWVLPGDDGVVNVETEVQNEAGFADYVLKDSSNFPLCIIEAKKELISPLAGKEQARRYAESLHCRFVILSNGVSHYFWDIEQGSPTVIDVFPSPEQFELRKSHFNPPRQEVEEIGIDYIAQTQVPKFEQHPDYLDEGKRGAFLRKNKLRLLRDYQLEAVKAVQSSIAKGKDRFLLEMATGTGKTLTSSAMIKMFLRLYKVKRVLFLVDRLELEAQAQKEFDEVLKNDFRTVVWKENRSDWTKAEIVVSTVQSFVSHNKYRKVFRPNHFDLVISDEAHRSLGARSRKVFEYFIGFKLGLTATPKDYLKSVDVEGLTSSDPRQLEKRMILDTYTTFGCDSGEPTFRYSLEKGVTDGFLINPKVMDARTKITTELLSEQGYVFQGTDDDGTDYEQTVTQKDFEKKFFSHNTNVIFCETFLKHAMRDPYTGEIGKTLVFCVSQNHAMKIAQILNVLADKMFPNQYNSDFAVQVTSGVQDSQRMTIDFRNNTLNGRSKTNPHYMASKTRVCVTVGMMTTGYDCTDILNLCMMRPIYSPGEFIQMKGRGTRKWDFSQAWMTQSEIPDHIEPEKKQFLLFDFFGNYDFFEKDFDYDEVLTLPARPSEPDEPTVDPPNIDGLVSTAPDPLAELREILIPYQGMKIDRELYRSFKKQVVDDSVIRELVKQQNFDRAETYLKDKVLDKPTEYFTIEKIRKSLGLDRPLTVPELLLHVFGHIGHIPSQRECLEEEFDKLDKAIKPDDSVYSSAKKVFEAYVVDGQFRYIIDNKKFAELSFHTSGDTFKELPPELQEGIPSYIRQNVDLERLQSVR
ncbi:DEAD/DEAH box helicase family protein [Candidatus Haliotispira prima]|uniref:DEAD/DEAH box helicase family protein n=1 Tax=Candidatus Haliotispira prima TaxID=3034016 RepID=A0ABY8MH68_9SPIO|nr:DEAD/DEAH box helicase family protein [Candidatus Haliotispira prima]